MPEQVSDVPHIDAGAGSEAVLRVLNQHGITKTLAKQAIDITREKGAFTIFSVVDALTKLSVKIAHPGDRTQADERAGRLLALAR